ncbi:predicted protein [Sclerotinia sclerotiorum 1980 UF-70]|uniref:Uncharacterized protein n=1 Tax=Sclerotinia sclerotiorum (strain ATCC 18683 / 1980 / Ss-1) TaxID=665079 RepID=A7ENH1_SCLS1|nr:predicted protein [Sclerotinia sclerotiorum 1980 UF-70]EDO04387.1 predicted protein [Sclerotinia sclerotiorum 1980 UF-70]
MYRQEGLSRQIDLNSDSNYPQASTIDDPATNDDHNGTILPLNIQSQCAHLISIFHKHSKLESFTIRLTWFSH